MLKKPKKANSKKNLRNKADKLWFKACMEEWGYECSVCGEKATQVHHFFPKGRFGHLRYDIDNGVPICQSCHFKHHHIGDPRINQEIIDVRGMKWYRELEKKSKKKPTSYQTIAWYKDNIKRLEKELEEK